MLTSATSPALHLSAAVSNPQLLRAPGRIIFTLISLVWDVLVTGEGKKKGGGGVEERCAPRSEQCLDRRPKLLTTEIGRDLRFRLRTFKHGKERTGTLTDDCSFVCAVHHELKIPVRVPKGCIESVMNQQRERVRKGAFIRLNDDFLERDLGGPSGLFVVLLASFCIVFVPLPFMLTLNSHNVRTHDTTRTASPKPPSSRQSRSCVM
jgi:hypothetical protein